jgi:Peptidase family M48
MRFITFLLLVGFAGVWSADTRAQDCSPPPIKANAKIYNIFSPDQEMVLGDLVYKRMSSELRFIREPALVNYVSAIGERLIAHLPPTGLKFRFFIIDIPESNAFVIPGGNVFISRKLISFTKTEDELAGVIAHELGHATVRHGASDYSDLLKKILNVTQVGDARDIAEKYNLLLERWRTKTVSRSWDRLDEKQLEADHIGVFALTAAGYDPEGLLSFFQRLTEAKSGNWLTAFFGSPSPDEHRVREMIKLTGRLRCHEPRKATASEEFLKWQADVVSYREVNKTAILPGLLWKRELKPKLRSDISHLAFSQDGKYFLAQDDFAISVIRREPLEAVFQISVSDAEPAHFTTDGQFVVFGTTGLRFEKWSIAERKPVVLRELVVTNDCWEHAFSDDGKYLACVDYQLNLDVLDTDTGKRIWQEREFYGLSYAEYDALYRFDEQSSEAERSRRLFRMEFSPDSQFLLVSRSEHFRVTSFTPGMGALVQTHFADITIPLNLTTLKRVGVGDGLRTVTRRPFAFIDSQKIVGLSSRNKEDSGVFSFPEGKRLARFTLAAKEIQATGNPNYVIIKPLQNAKLGVIEVNTGKVVFAIDKAAVAIWKDLMVYESISGEVMLSQIKMDEKKGFENTFIAKIEVPVGSMNRLETAELSDNFQWLAASSRTRGALWNVASGERKQFLRGFNGAIIGNDGGCIADFPKLGVLGHSLALMNPQNDSSREIRALPEKGARQFGLVVLVRQSLAPAQKTPTKPGEEPATDSDPEADVSLTKAVKFELRSVVNDQVVWSREFPKEAPRFSFDQFSGRLILYWRLGSDVGKQRLKNDAALAARAKEMGSIDDDYLVEVVDASARNTVGTLIVDTGKGSFTIASGLSQGEWLVLYDTGNRVLVYSTKNGELRHRFFGQHAAMIQERALLAVENYPGELSFYNLSTGDSVAHVTLGADAVFIRFSVDGKRLFVLSGEQTAYAFDVEKLIAHGVPGI